MKKILFVFAALMAFSGGAYAGLSLGNYRIVDTGRIYYSNGEGDVCSYYDWDHYVLLNGDRRDWTNIYALPSDVRYGGICTGSRVPESGPGMFLDEGRFRTPDGTIYWSNGRGEVCRYVDWDQYVRHGGTAYNFTNIPRIPRRVRYGGYCAG